MTMMRSKGSPELISSFRQNILSYGDQSYMQIFPYSLYEAEVDQEEVYGNTI